MMFDLKYFSTFAICKAIIGLKIKRKVMAGLRVQNVKNFQDDTN
jgi:hypothetical protein